ncbi:dTDP-4-dehydrorhamnose 3,5-epimerase [Sphingomonas prati]|uniref:dTDP-4-dehydrorhamnose 3,5-epimerase n=1 Tax=Sphingomonas prati TaxID=1843237 RepID=A0A7W9BTR1_9SPHN|nr:dTDP-4-dehydrorhamnose 3,5-epimerase [Sphingomonas prati]MBB5729835.1 dTDP-4-dehydrorhamnose 3,5-epimerase [Sphingomonas prati]GGE89140.1 dTDP-4-dehydrorhamnose 3,5-epimerase [Sphingomonas prati]
MTGSPVRLIHTRRFGDDRGWFSETYRVDKLAAEGITETFVQDNQSYSVHTGTIRGIHFQKPPMAQGKLVRCVRGSIMDYAVDLRRGSPTYGQHLSARLDAQTGDQLWIPVGFGHAFVTLEPDVEVAYKVTRVYAPETEGGIRWDCPVIGIDWPLPPAGAALSAKDMILPSLSDFDSPFDYDGVPLGTLND